MKIAIPCDGENVASHFGRCEKYLIADLDNNELKTKEFLQSPSHEPYAIPNMLAERGVTVLICSDLGPMAVDTLKELNIEVIAGVSGNADEAVQKYIRGELDAGKSNCNHT